jgi:hypothetical protein
MKKTLTATASRFALAALLLAVWFPAAVSALPSAEAAIRISDAVYDGGDIIVTAEIAVGAPSESYASLDFNLVSSDYERLQIVDLNDSEEVTELDVAFAPGYGHAIHKGRPDGDTGGYRYLIGIFSQTGGNLIDGATDICSVKLRYSGEEPQTLLVRDMKLVYVDEAGGVGSAPVGDPAVLTIDRNLVVELDDSEVPLSSPSLPGGGNIPPVLWLVIGVLAGASATGVTLAIRKKRIPDKPAS